MLRWGVRPARLEKGGVDTRLGNTYTHAQKVQDFFFFFEQLRFLVKLPDLDFHGDNFKFLSS